MKNFSLSVIEFSERWELTHLATKLISEPRFPNEDFEGEKSWKKKIFHFGKCRRSSAARSKGNHQNSKEQPGELKPSKRTYHFPELCDPPWKLPNIWKNQYLRRLFTRCRGISRIRQKTFRLLPFFSMSLLHFLLH